MRAKTGTAVQKAIEEGWLPLVLGGDIRSRGSVGGVAAHFKKEKKQIGCIWLDATVT